jgi:hypothetical protein
VLSTASLIPCSGGQTKVAVVGWVLGLLVSNAPSFYSMPMPGAAAGLAVGAMVCFAAMLIVALGAAVALWRLLSVRRDVQREWGGVNVGERVRDIKARGRLPGCSFCRYGDRPIPPLFRGNHTFVGAKTGAYQALNCGHWSSPAG